MKLKRFESEHYLFHYEAASQAERDLTRIVSVQEGCFEFICQVLRVKPSFKLSYFLCASPEEVGRLYGDNEPCNGFAAPPDRIYAVYNERVHCIGFHEDAHLLSELVGHPNSPAIREGLAMYFDRQWWGIQNFDWAVRHFKAGQSPQISRLIDREYFFSVDETFSYPVMGAFTDWLISAFGIEQYLRFYREKDAANGFLSVYQKTPAEMDEAFIRYLQLFSLDSALEKRMEELLNA